MQDEASIRAEKLDPSLRQLLADGVLPDVLPVIIQTQDGLKPEDRQLLSTIKGVFKDDLHIINAFSANIPGRALEMLILSPRVVRIYHDAPVHES